MTETQNASRSLGKKILRIFLRIFISLLIIFILLVLFIRSPWGQDIIVGKVTDYVSEKIDTKFNIGKLYITFSGNVTLEDLYLEDTSQDTLVYSQYLEANVPFRPLLFGDEIKVDFVEWQGLKANVIRKDSIEGFNYQYIVDAFASSEEKPASASATESSDSTTQISVGSIDFLDFYLNYIDEVTGIDTQLVLGNLEVDLKSIDLQNMKFHISEVNLKETYASYFQFKTLPPSENQEDSKSPWILVDELKIENLELNYTSKPDDINSEAFIRILTLSELNANLEEKDIQLANFIWKDSRTKLETQTPKTSNEKAEAIAESSSFEWPQWNIKVGEIDFKNQKIEFYQNGKRSKKGEFSPGAIAFESFNLNLKDINLSKAENLSFQLNEFSFNEASGIQLKELSLDTRLSSRETNLENLKVRLNTSSLHADLKLNYADLNSLINSPENSQVQLNISSLKANLSDAFVFSQELKKNEQIQSLAQRTIEGNLQLNGDVNRLQIPKFQLGWGKNTSLKFNGTVSNITDVDKLDFKLNNLKAESKNNDLSKFLSEESVGIALPEKVTLRGDFKKEGTNFSAKSNLRSSIGDVQLDGYLNSRDTVDYEVSFKIRSLKLGQVLKNEKVGDLSMQLSSKGKGNTIYELTANLSSKIDSIRWDDYVFKGLEIKGDLEKGNGDVAFDYGDENLQFDFVSDIQLDSVSPKVDVRFNLEGIRTQNLGLSSKDLRAKVLANIHFEGNADQFQLDAELNDGLVVYDDKPYYLGDFVVSSKVDSTQTKAEITSQFLNGKLSANTNIQGISNALQNHLRKYTKDSVAYEKPARPVNLDLNLNFNESPILSDVFVDGINEMDTLRAFARFEEAKENLTAGVSLSYLKYQDNEIAGLNFDSEIKQNSANFKLGFDNIMAGPLDIATTQIKGQIEDNLLTLNLDAFEENKDFFSSVVFVNFQDNGFYKISVSPDELILNGSQWTIPDNNQIVIDDDSIEVDNFKVSKDSQYIELSNTLDFEKQHLGIVIDNFKLSTFTSYFNPDEKLASGELSGNFVIIEPLVSNGLVSNLGIDDLRVTEVPLGNLSLKAEARSEEDYLLNLGLKGAGIDLSVDGIYHTNPEESDIDLSIDLEKLEIQKIESFAPDFIEKSGGSLAGNFEVNGPLNDLNYKGDLVFNEAQFKLKLLNNLFKLNDEKIKLSKNTISFNNFTVKDTDGNSLSVNGKVNTEELSNPKFDLKLEASKFQLLNSTAEDNDLSYGTLVFDSSAKIRGDLELPKINLDLTIRDETDLTYIVPESEASIVEREGIVVFVNKENPDDILSKKEDDDLKAVMSGIDLKSNIKIKKKSKVKVVFNERTGDNVKIRGGGDFKFSLSRTGRMNLSGKYEVSNGSVELNLYNIVKRQFDIAPSSTVTWSGDPYNAALDLRAIYKIETSASALMASQTAGESSITQNRYKQRLPFIVYLDVKGELMSPELSFQLDMPEDRQGAINGSVYAKINQVNQREDQLNKQVFSLLVLNRFYPESGSDGSQGGPATMARDNLNQALSDQLNTYSDKLTGNTGISLNFDVNSYTDYQGATAQSRTEVDVTAQKKLMDDRLVVEAGSSVNVEGQQRPGESQSIVGNVSVEYLLTEDGRWKLRGFRKSEYENVIDGQVFVSGIALIFTREFNKFKVLWDKAYRESLKEGDVEDEPENKNKDEEETETKKDE